MFLLFSPFYLKKILLIFFKNFGLIFFTKNDFIFIAAIKIQSKNFLLSLRKKKFFKFVKKKLLSNIDFKKK